MMNEGGVYEWDMCLRGIPLGRPGGMAPLLGTQKDLLKRYIERDVKMPFKRVSLYRGPALKGVRLLGLFERK
jgi:hypothetical protein